MKSKQFLVFVAFLTSVGLPIAVQAAPLVSIGDSVDVFFNGSSSLEWQSNVFSDESGAVDDFEYTVTPGFEVNVGRGLSNLDLSIITRYEIVRFDEVTDLDNELFHIKAVGSYAGSRLSVNGLVSYDENQSNGADGNDNQKGKLSASETTAANLNGEYTLSPKFSFGAGVNYNNREYKESSSADRKSYTIPLDIFYELTPKVDLSIGYTYTSTEVSRAGTVSPEGLINGVDGYDKEQHFVNVGARGDLLPKLNGSFKIGFNTMDSDKPLTLEDNVLGRSDRDSSSSLGLDASFTYLATAKVSTNLNLNRNFDVAGQGESTEATKVDLSANYSINTRFTATANLGYTLREYVDTKREDDNYRTGLSLSYVPNEYWRFSTGYNYTENDSSSDGQSYEAHVINVSASLRY